MTSTELTGRNQKIDIVATNIILGHVDNGSCDTCFTMMVLSDTSNVIGQLSNLFESNTVSFMTNAISPYHTLISVFLPRLIHPKKTLRWPGLKPSTIDGIDRMLSLILKSKSSWLTKLEILILLTLWSINIPFYNRIMIISFLFIEIFSFPTW